MNESLRPSVPQRGCFEIAITICLLVFVAFPMSIYQMAKEKTLETVADMAIRNIDVVVLTESNPKVVGQLLRCADRGEPVAESEGCRLCPVSMHTELPAGYVKPEYLQVQDNGIVVPVYAVLKSQDKARKWLAENGYTGADFVLRANSSDRLQTYIHRKPLGDGFYHRSEIALAAFSSGGDYYIYDYKIFPPSDGDSGEGYRAFMQVRK